MCQGFPPSGLILCFRSRWLLQDGTSKYKHYSPTNVRISSRVPTQFLQRRIIKYVIQSLVFAVGMGGCKLLRCLYVFSPNDHFTLCSLFTQRFLHLQQQAFSTRQGSSSQRHLSLRVQVSLSYTSSASQAHVFICRIGAQATAELLWRPTPQSRIHFSGAVVPHESTHGGGWVMLRGMV